MGLKLQKFAPIDREFPVYEITDDSGDVILDVSRADDGTLELGLQKLAAGRIVSLREVLRLIDEACKLIETD
jgi:hypothetical protein